MTVTRNIYSCKVTNVCTGEEYKQGRTYFSATGLFLSEIVGRKDRCLTERSGCLTERSEVQTGSEVRQSF